MQADGAIKEVFLQFNLKKAAAQKNAVISDFFSGLVQGLR